MIDEPYRWLEAIGNRREYVRDQLKTGSPVFAVSSEEGILLLGVGQGHSKVFELFDRHALAGLGHPADIEKVRQAAIDSAHIEAFNRAPEDVSLRRLIGFGLSPQLKTNFEQIFSAPFLVELILAELGSDPSKDVIVRLHFDGAFESFTQGPVVAAIRPEAERAAQAWLKTSLKDRRNRSDIVEMLLQAWWCLVEDKAMDDTIPGESERRDGWRKALNGRTVELGFLERSPTAANKYSALAFSDLNL